MGQDNVELEQDSVIPEETESMIRVAIEEFDSPVVGKSESESVVPIDVKTELKTDIDWYLASIADSTAFIDSKKNLDTPIVTEKTVQQDEAKLDQASVITVDKESVVPVTTKKSD